MTNVKPIRPEYYYPDLIYSNRREYLIACRIRKKIQERFPDVKLSVRVKALGLDQPEVDLYLKDFPEPIFIRQITAEEFRQASKKMNFLEYLSPKYLILRNDLDKAVKECFTTTVPSVYVEAVGQVVRRCVVG